MKAVRHVLSGILLVLAISFSATPVGAARWSIAYDTPEEAVYSLAVYNNMLFAGTSNGKIYVYDGTTWQESYSSPEDLITAFAVYDGKLYAGGDPNGMVFVFDGENWSEMEDSPGEPIRSMAVYGGKLYAGTDSGIFVYEGGTWSQSHDSGASSLVVYNDKLYAGSSDSGAIYRFDGTFWVLSMDLIYPNWIPSLAVYGNRLYIGTGNASGEIYVSDGYAYSMSYDILEPAALSLAAYSDNLFAGVSSSGSIYTYNGTTWSLSYDTDEEDIYSIVTYGTRLYAGTGPNGRIYCFTDFDFSLGASPDNLELSQSPVSTSVTVNLVSGQSETVSLSGQWVGTAPTGINVSFSRTSGTPPFTSTLTFRKTGAAGGGSFTYRITASGGGLTRTKDITVIVVAPPSAPTLVSPENGVAIDTLTPTFDWSDVYGATSYTLEVATDNGFRNVIITKSVTDSNATLSQIEALSYGTIYYWRVRGTNAAGEGSWSSIWSFTPKLSAPKVIEFTAAGGAAYTNSPTVQLSITAQNAAEVSFSEDMVNWTNWEPYRTSMSYTLSGPDGLKRIYLRVRDNNGDVGATSAISITLDMTPPLTQKDLTGDLTPDGYKGSVVVTLSAMDSTSGVSRIMYRIDGGEWKSASRTEVSFPITSDGRHTVEYYAVDLAGNEESPKSFEVKVYVPGGIPEYVWLIPAIVAAAGIAAFYGTSGIRMRRRLRAIRTEKEELLRMKKEAETKFYKEATMSRENFDAVMSEYRRRMAELEKEEGVLARKIGKKAVKKR